MQTSSSILLISVLIAVLAGSTTWSSAAEAQVMGADRTHQVAAEIQGEVAPQVDGVIPVKQLVVQDFTLGQPFVLSERTVEFIHMVTNTVIDTTLEVFDYLFDN